MTRTIGKPRMQNATDPTPGQGRPLPDAAALRAHPLHGIAPVGAPYVLGLWHKDRATLKGYGFEARIFLKSLGRRGAEKKFLILGRARSGTTLLYRLLNQVPGIRCDAEVLHHAVLAPRAFLNRLARTSEAPVYGAKLISYQIFEVQKIARPERFLAGLVEDGFRLIHLTRNTFDQALSLSVAQGTGRYHLLKGAGGAEERQVTLDLPRFQQQIRWNLAMLDYETQLMARFDHLSVQYESDLACAAAHQPAIDRICAYLGVPPGPVAADLTRARKAVEVTNLDELTGWMRTAGHGAILDGALGE